MHCTPVSRSACFLSPLQLHYNFDAVAKLKSVYAEVMNPALEEEEEEEPRLPEPVPKSGKKETERGKKDKPVAEGKRGEGQEGALGHVCGCCLREGVRGGCVAMSEAHCFIP